MGLPPYTPTMNTDLKLVSLLFLGFPSFNKTAALTCCLQKPGMELVECQNKPILCCGCSSISQLCQLAGSDGETETS